MMRSFPLGLLLLVVAVSAMGCVTAGTVEVRTAEIEKLIRQVHGPASVCAPKQLAEAEVFIDLARYEAGRGDTVLAKDHLEKASDLTAELWQLSQGQECETDIDFDGILDSKDGCPEEPEDYDGMEDTDGCPEDDTDGDGLSDRIDACPRDAEDFDNFEDKDGCPELDNDQDGINDTLDQCPNQPEDRDQFEEEDGCPDLDNDQDGIQDRVDKCPNEAEDFDGDQDEDGCPDLYKNIVVTDKMIDLRQKVFFKYNKAKILPRSFDMLNEVADVLKKNPTMVVRIEGHTDSKGGNRYNKKLSTKRARSVEKYLQSQGVNSDNMESVGYGEDKPIADNSTEEGRQKNRRVEFHIISR